jgi:hypothetical protein
MRPREVALLTPALVCSLCIVAFDAAAQPLTPAQQADFLRTARIVKSAPIGKGVTRPFRLTLSDGAFTHDAAFQSVNETRTMSNTGRGGKPELNFVDSWRFNIVAHRLAALLGIGDMVPASGRGTARPARSPGGWTTCSWTTRGGGRAGRSRRTRRNG